MYLLVLISLMMTSERKTPCPIVFMAPLFFCLYSQSTVGDQIQDGHITKTMS